METEPRQRQVSRWVGANVREVRLAAHLTLTELSERLTAVGWPIQRPGLSKIETGQVGISVDALLALATALQTTPAALLAPRPPARKA